MRLVAGIAGLLLAGSLAACQTTGDTSGDSAGDIPAEAAVAALAGQNLILTFTGSYGNPQRPVSSRFLRSVP